MKTRQTGWMVVWLAVAAACGTTEKDVPATLREACGDLGEAICDRGIECFPNDAPAEADCVHQFVGTCCESSGTCGNAVRAEVTAARWNDCLEGFDSLTCPEVEDDTLPSACDVGG